MLLRWWSPHGGTLPLCPKSVSFPPRCDGPLTLRAADIMPKTASHWFGDVVDFSAAGFNLDIQVQRFKVRVLMLRVIYYLPVFYVIILVISWRQVAWVVNRLHRAKEHRLVVHFRDQQEGSGGAEQWKLHSSECSLILSFFQSIVALFSIQNLWCRIYHLVLKEVVFFFRKKIKPFWMCFCCWNISELVTCPCSHLKGNRAYIKYSPHLGLSCFIVLQRWTKVDPWENNCLHTAKYRRFKMLSYRENTRRRPAEMTGFDLI